ncbi:MAG: DUF4383 domain-containing protein [Chlamydiales bacterium]|nr:DUF4383 domain-containing protein [Chlamydiales bacterium]
MNTCSTSSENKSVVLTAFAIIYGIVFLLVGIAGFIPALMMKDLLFGIFNVDALHNVIHIVFGIIGLWVACTSRSASRIYFKVVGIIYVILAILGFWSGNDPVLGTISNNLPVAWLHLAIGIVALILGFCTCCKKCHKA